VPVRRLIWPLAARIAKNAVFLPVSGLRRIAPHGSEDLNTQ
jgi:hypothetical protein